MAPPLIHHINTGVQYQTQRAFAEKHRLSTRVCFIMDISLVHLVAVW